MTTTRVPAGWYPDPLGDGETTRRWWNGEIWTEYTAPLTFDSPSSAASVASPADTGSAAVSIGTVAGGPLAPTAHDSALAALGMTLHAGAPATSLWDALPSVSSATVFSPATMTPALDGLVPLAAAQPAAPPATRMQTSAVWIMTAMPAVHLLLAVAMATRYPEDAPSWTIALALLLPLVCCAGLADVDARQLADDGHLRVPPWILALIAAPLYLLVRGALLARIDRAAWAPLIVWAAVQVAVLALALLLAPAALAAVVALIV